MSAFSERELITGSLSYLRQQAQRLGCNPCFDHLPLVTALKMNENGIPATHVSGPKLRCIDGIRLCPCETVMDGGECDQGIFKSGEIHWIPKSKCRIIERKETPFNKFF